LIRLKLKKESIFNIEIDKIKPNSSQPRNSLSEEGLKELAESIKATWCIAAINCYKK